MMYYKRINKSDYCYNNAPIALKNSYKKMKNTNGVVVSSDEKGEFILVPTNLVDEFVITALSRQDVSSRGFNADDLTDDDMAEIANAMEANYIEYGGYWDEIDSECLDRGMEQDESVLAKD